MPKLVKEPGGVAAKVELLVRPLIEEMGIRLWDVRFEKEGTQWFLKIYIDKDSPMDTDTCEAVSKAIDPILDRADPISQSYFLEVGSPGLGRKLTRDFHYGLMAGQKVRINFFAPAKDGKKESAGLLKGLCNGQIAIETPEGEQSFALEDVAAVKLCDDEDLF